MRRHIAWSILASDLAKAGGMCSKAAVIVKYHRHYGIP
jgi:hypothetical protein